MNKINYYTYLGTNGTLKTPIHLKDMYSIKSYLLIADENKVITNGIETHSSIEVLEDDLDKWYEVDKKRNGQN